MQGVGSRTPRARALGSRGVEQEATRVSEAGSSEVIVIMYVTLTFCCIVVIDCQNQCVPIRVRFYS